MQDELLLLENERLRQMLAIAAKDISELEMCSPNDYLHDLSTRDYYEEMDWGKNIVRLNIDSQSDLGMVLGIDKNLKKTRNFYVLITGIWHVHIFDKKGNSLAKTGGKYLNADGTTEMLMKQYQFTAAALKEIRNVYRNVNPKIGIGGEYLEDEY